MNWAKCHGKFRNTMISANADSLHPGQVIYMQPKRNKAEAGKNAHIVKEGETMYTISQLVCHQT